ncbi:MAG: glycosyltransferase family 2 protein [Bacteroidales bacterium]|nr:glycosyltransferase family 2 protein [Bacteroidales bacterium]HNW73293.1 glycosyltransferase family 2 protein [Bacteroidales bacterium]HPS50374.1 glycosyltransferase family 2 protein [Bacteroidales bacterium]
MTADNHGDLTYPFLHLAMPVKDEPDFLPRILNCLSLQSYKQFRLYVCINQPDSWWHDPRKRIVCEHNADSIRFLRTFKEFELVFVDHSSEGKGWVGKKTGVGFARRAIMETIRARSADHDVIVSLDADTLYGTDYLLSVANSFKIFPEISALAIPYFHRESTDPLTTRSMLRYEIYMRYYFLNLSRIRSPYTFTALGSALACPVSAYKAIGGMTPKLSGEDFYFLQKLKKYGHVLNWNDQLAFPEGRPSDRVFFGTGPAIIRGNQGDWSGYPIFPSSLFDTIQETYLLLPLLFKESIPTVVIQYLSECFGEPDPLLALRQNHKSSERFIRAFHEKFDGLRILQFLKSQYKQNGFNDMVNLLEYFQKYNGESIADALNIPAGMVLDEAPVEILRKIRMLLFEKEMECRFNSVPG